MNVFDLANFDYSFDISKFGDAINLTPESQQTLNNTPIFISDWQIDELKSNNMVTLSDHFQNPTTLLCSTLTTTLHAMSTVISPITFTNDITIQTQLNTNINNCIIEISKFKAHTDNISGVATASGYTNPSYTKIISTGRQLLIIAANIDGMANTLPVLGNFTSLYINDDLTSNNTTLNNDIITLTNSIDSPNNTSNISNSSAAMIISDVQKLSTLISTRRIADTNFYQNSLNIINHYNFLTTFSNMGPTQQHIINNLVGTPSLKAKIASSNTA